MGDTPKTNEKELESAVRALNAAYQTGFELIELCLAQETMEHGVAMAVRRVMDRELSRLWSLVIVKNTPADHE